MGECRWRARYRRAQPERAGALLEHVGGEDKSLCHMLFLHLPGMFCVSQGLTQPSGLCHSGHYCTGGAVSPTPIQHKVGNTGPQKSRVYGLGTTKLLGSLSFPTWLQLPESQIPLMMSGPQGTEPTISHMIVRCACISFIFNTNKLAIS